MPRFWPVPSSRLRRREDWRSARFFVGLEPGRDRCVPARLARKRTRQELIPGGGRHGEEKLERVERSRLARECAKLDPKFEKALAEEGMSEDSSESTDTEG